MRRTRKITARLSTQTLNEFKFLAKSLALPYTTMIRMMLLSDNFEPKAQSMLNGDMNGLLDERVDVLMNDEEFEIIKNKAKKAELSVSAYTRMVILRYISEKKSD